MPSNYALPLAVATISFGLDPILRKGGMAALRSPEGAAVVGVSLLVGCFVLWLNRFALRTAIQPKIAELEQLRRGLADPESSSTTAIDGRLSSGPGPGEGLGLAPADVGITGPFPLLLAIEALSRHAAHLQALTKPRRHGLR